MARDFTVLKPKITVDPGDVLLFEIVVLGIDFGLISVIKRE